jgi:signal transduction histidine kinase/HAMP domain-containing protein
MFIIQAIYTYNRFQLQRANELQANLEAARSMAGAFKEFIHKVVGQELAIGIHLSSSELLSVEAMNRILSKNQTENPALRGFSWISPQGRVIASSNESSIGADVGDRLFFREILSGREWFVDNVVLSRVIHKPIVAISRGIRNDEGELLGVVMGAVSPDTLEEALPVKRDEGRAWSIIDAAGMLVSHHPHVDLAWEERNLLHAHPFLREVLQGSEVTTTAVFPQDEREYIVAAVPAGSFGWAIVAGRSEEEAMGPVRIQLIQHVTLFLTLTIVVILTALAISHAIAAPIKKLQEVALALGRGGIKQSIEVGGFAELKELSSAFNTMAEEIGVREEALQSERQRVLSVLEAIPGSVSLQAPDYSIRYANHVFRETFGAPQGKLCYEMTRGRDKPCEECTVSRIFDTHSPQEREWTSPGGRSYIIYNHPFADIDGSPLVLKLGVDITKLKRAEEEARAQRETLERVFESAPYIMMLVNKEGRVTKINRTGAAFSGGSKEELLGLLGGEVFNCLNAFDGLGCGRNAECSDCPVRTRVMRTFQTGESIYKAEGCMTIRKDSTDIAVDMLISTTPIKDRDSDLVLVTIADITERKRAENELRSLPVRLLAAQEEERKRIAHELHDSIGGSLGAIQFGLQNTLALAQSGASCSEAIESLSAMVQQTRDEARRIYANLRPSMLDDLGVIATIGWFTRQFQEIYSGIHIEKQIQTEEEAIPEPLKIVIFRIIQEAFHNVAKYSKADMVRVSLSGENGSIGLIIADNGVGLDARSDYKIRGDKGGLGLTSMRERVQLSGGTFAIESALGEGTTIRASWGRSRAV